MAETPDPYEALASKQVRDQAAGARDLARIGTWADMALLVDKATHSKSAAVRLYASAAAADITHRARLAGEVDAAREQEILGWVSAANPDLSAGLLMLLSAVRDPRALDRVGRFLRDPRNGVRAGAVATLRRMALSHCPQDPDALTDRVRDWLRHPKLPADAALDLVQVTGEVGWTALAAELPRHGHHSERHEEAVALASERLAARETVDGWAGLYRDTGLDVFELPTGEGAVPPARWLAMGRTSGLTLDGAPIDGEPGQLGDAPARLVWAPPLGHPEERRRVIQSAGRSYWEVSPAEVQDLLAEDPERLPAMPEQMPDPTLTLEGVNVPRTRALWAWVTGDLDTARAGLDALTAKGRPPQSLLYWLACVAAAQGDVEAACLAAGAYLDRAKKTAPLRERAHELIERLAVRG